MLVSTELLKGEPSFFGLLGHDQSRFILLQRDARTEDGLRWGGDSNFLYNTHARTHNHMTASEDRARKYSVGT